MAVLNPKKIDSVKAMLQQYFSNNDPVTRDYLLAKVDADTIAIADKEGFIAGAGEKYRITQSGKDYRDK